MMEMRIILANLIWQFDMTLKDANQGEPAYDHRRVSAADLEVRLKRVERNESFRSI